MARTTGEKTREKLIFQSFLLFSKKPYNEVTFTEIENVTGFCRGTILYHAKSKQVLFELVVKSSLLSRSTILDIPIREKQCLKGFILDFMENCRLTIEKMKEQGIPNVNLAHYNIESQALYYYNQFDALSKKMLEKEIEAWRNVIEIAKEKNEIKCDVDCQLLATLFHNAYLGHAYSSAKNENGCDLNELSKELLGLYSIISC